MTDQFHPLLLPHFRTAHSKVGRIPHSEITEHLAWTNDKIELHVNSQQPSVQGSSCYRGEIFWAVLGKNIGSEENKRRPVLVLQNNRTNIHGSTTLVAPITKLSMRKIQPYEVKISLHTQDPKDATKLIPLVSGIVLLQQIRVISKARLEKKICDLNDQKLLSINLGAEDIMFRVERACKRALALS